MKNVSAYSQAPTGFERQNLRVHSASAVHHHPAGFGHTEHHKWHSVDTRKDKRLGVRVDLCVTEYDQNITLVLYTPDIII
jgi:hypothetical protein